MKTQLSFLVCIALALILVSCDKDNTPDVACTDDSVNCQVQGEWEWVRTYGTIAGTTWTPGNTGNTRRLQINDTELSLYQNDTLINQTSYEVFVTDTIFRDTIDYTFIKYDGNIRRLNLNGDELEFFDLCFDCLDDYYVRK